MKKSVEVAVNNPAPLSKVWQALTTPEIIEKYFFGTRVHTDWKVGSPIYFRGEYQGMRYEDKGEILQFIPQKNIKYSYWSAFSGLPDSPEHYQIVSYELASKGELTQVTVRQENLKDDTQEHKKHVQENWKMVLDGLEKIFK